MKILALRILSLTLPSSLSLLGSLALAQEATPLLRRGDLVGGQPVRAFQQAIIADDGTWQTVVHPSEPPLLALVLRDGAAVRTEGERLDHPGPGITSVRVIRFFGLEGAGPNTTQYVTLNDFVPVRPGPVAGILRGDRLLVVTNEPIDLAGLPPETRTGNIEKFAANATDTVVAVIGIGGGERVLARFRFAPDGSPIAREALLRTGDALADGALVANLGRPETSADGVWLVRVPTADGGVRLLSSGGTVVRTGDLSPLPGRTVERVLASYDRNAFGGVAAALELSGDPATDLVLWKNGSVLWREGDPIPSLDPGRPAAPLAGIGRVELSDSGAVFWHALVPGPLPQPAAGLGSMLRDGVPFLETGVSRVAGELVVAFQPSLENFEISPSGRFWLGRVALESSQEAYLRVDLGAAIPVPGCTPNAGTLRHTEGLVLAGRTIRLVLDGPARLGSLAILHVSTAAAVPGSPCGLMTPFGELLIDPGQRILRVSAGFFAGVGVPLDVRIPPDRALVDRVFWAQGAFQAPGTSPLLTNGLRIEIGAP